VSRNIEEILGLEVEEKTRDWVLWEGNPLGGAGSVVLTMDGEEGVVSCWPEVR